MDYKSVIESKYNRQLWLDLLHDIFKSGAIFRNTPIQVDAHSPLVKSSVQLGTITLSDSNKIAVYEIQLSDCVDIVVNRVGIRNLLKNDWKYKGCVGAFLFCYRENESVLRFSYVSNWYRFNEQGILEVNETETKRFTYLLGDGHRSRTAIEQFKNLKESGLTLDDVTKAFSVESLNKRFFEEYRQIYDNIIEYITGKRWEKVGKKWKEVTKSTPNDEAFSQFAKYSDPQKCVRDYVKRLMGRIVFLQFIQKKGWLGLREGQTWGEGNKEFLKHLFDTCQDKEHFIRNVLVPIFYDLNTSREDDIPTHSSLNQYKIPFINGGFFELSEIDAADIKLSKDLMQRLIEFFDSYNFTIDENSPEDEEFGIDPEMLGRIFESLLEDNKDKGAYYTPKAIVQYMCREAIISHLDTHIPGEHDSIKDFVYNNDAEPLNPILKSRILESLTNIKVCDPAIGSGAFPMGILKELFNCRTALEEINDSAALKRAIIINNLYGVDIDPSAIDIARLRFGLTIIVDEKQPRPLPNLEYKIIQGDSLVKKYNNINLDFTQDGNINLGIFDAIRKEIRDSIIEHINCHTLCDKIRIKSEIINSISRLFETCSSRDIPSSLIEEPNNKFFLWNIYFSEAFQDKRNLGFDIVIGNPPYGATLTDEQRELYKASSSLSTTETAMLFMERCKELAKNNGVISLIIPKAFTYASNYKKVRDIVEPNLSTLVDCGKAFENVKLEQCIIICNKSTKTTSYENYVHNGKVFNFIGNINKSSKKIFGLFLNDVQPKELELALMIHSNSVKLGDISSNTRGETMQRSVVDDGKYPVIGGNEIDKYGVRKVKGYLTRPILGKAQIKENSLLFQNIVAHIMNPYPHVKLIGCIPNSDEYFITDTINQITVNKKYNIKYIWALLNSKLLSWYVYSFIYGKAIRTMHFDSVSTDRIPIIVGENYKKIIELTDELLSNCEGDSERLEKEDELDRLIYLTYGLTYEDVLMIDPCSQISKEQYYN